MYAQSINNNLILLTELPDRVRLENGLTRTHLHLLNEEELNELEIYLVEKLEPEYNPATHRLILEELELVGNRAIASYAVSPLPPPPPNWKKWRSEVIFSPVWSRISGATSPLKIAYLVSFLQKITEGRSDYLEDLVAIWHSISADANPTEEEKAFFLSKCEECNLPPEISQLIEST